MSLLNSVHTAYKMIRKGVFTMKFTKNSPIVKSWVSLILMGNDGYAFEDVPHLFNLRAVVKSVLEGEATQN